MADPTAVASILNDGRRFAIIMVQAPMMQRMWRNTPEGQSFAVSEGLPDDAKFINAWFDPEHQTYKFLFEHESFPLTPWYEKVTATVTPLFHLHTCAVLLQHENSRD